jgi:hypothetical protein
VGVPANGAVASVLDTRREDFFEVLRPIEEEFISSCKIRGELTSCTRALGSLETVKVELASLPNEFFTLNTWLSPTPNLSMSDTFPIFGTSSGTWLSLLSGLVSRRDNLCNRESDIGFWLGDNGVLVVFDNIEAFLRQVKFNGMKTILQCWLQLKALAIRAPSVKFVLWHLRCETIEVRLKLSVNEIAK